MFRSFRLCILSAALVAGAVAIPPAMSQDAPDAPPAPVAAPPAPDTVCDDLKSVPKGKAIMLMALRERTLEIPYSTAVACETERCRLKATGVIGQCVWVR